MKKIFLTVILCFFFNSLVFSQSKEITLEDIWENYNFFIIKSYRGINSMNDGEFYTQIKNTDDGQEIIKYSFKNGERIVRLFKSSDFKIKRINSYSLSSDDKLMLLATETESIYRYSKKAIYYVFNIQNNKIKKLSDNKVRYPTFSPDGTKIAYVFENNLLYKKYN